MIQGGQDFLFSGLTPAQAQQLCELPVGAALFEHFTKIQEPLRLRDFQAHIRSLGLPEVRFPIPMSPSSPFLAAPIRHRGEAIGNFFLSEKEGGEFTPEDEETLVMFASQAALVISNARRYREEQRARARLETLRQGFQTETLPTSTGI